MIIQIENKNDSSIKKWLKYLRILYKGINFPKESIDKEFLQDIFYSLSDTRATEVANAINKYYKDYNIDTPERMAHFIGQIGLETKGLNLLKESHKYTARRIVELFRWTRNGHLYKEAKFDSITYKYNYVDINFDIHKCELSGANERPSKGDASFNYKSSQEIVNAYGDKLVKDTILDKSGKEIVINKFSNRNDIFSDGKSTNLKSKVKDKNYNSGRLVVKPEYLNNSKVFDVVYACKYGNGSISSGDGSKYKGVGFIHLTFKENYEKVYKKWKKVNKNSTITLEQFPEKMSTDIDIAMQTAMIYWEIKRINQKILESVVDKSSIEKITERVNGGKNGLENRISYTKKIYKRL
jgi:predicted chitinase